MIEAVGNAKVFEVHYGSLLCTNQSLFQYSSCDDVIKRWLIP